MRNFAADKLEKRLEKMGIFDKYSRPVNALFLSTKAKREECEAGAFCFMIPSQDKNVIYVSSMQATKCGDKNIPIDIRYEVILSDVAEEYFKTKHLKHVSGVEFPLTVIEIVKKGNN